MPWGHKTLQKGKEQLNFTDLTGFRSLSTIIWKIWTIFGEKMAKIVKSQFSGILRKLDVRATLSDALWANSRVITDKDNLPAFIAILHTYRHT